MNRIKQIVASLVLANPVFLVALLYGDIWQLREKCLRKPKKGFKRSLYYAYFDHFSAFIGLGAKMANIPTLPHGLFGIFISNSAVIGKNAVIYQQVCIGSNTLKDSKGIGAPTIGNNVFIGVGGGNCWKC